MSIMGKPQCADEYPGLHGKRRTSSHNCVFCSRIWLRRKRAFFKANNPIKYAEDSRKLAERRARDRERFQARWKSEEVTESSQSGETSEEISPLQKTHWDCNGCNCETWQECEEKEECECCLLDGICQAPEPGEDGRPD